MTFSDNNGKYFREPTLLWGSISKTGASDLTNLRYKQYPRKAESSAEFKQYVSRS